LSKQSEFIAEVAVHAVRSGVKWGVPPSLTIAQAALETGWGKHVLPGYNYFGVKGTGPAGASALPTNEVVNGDTIRVVAKFRRYETPEQSFDDHNRLLMESGFYKKTRSAIPDSTAMAHTLTGVYATDPEYGKKLEQIIRKYRLARFDPPAKPPKKRKAWLDLVMIIFNKFRDGWLEHIGGKPKT
jgi:flagellum-specific peptidoglycan hydrolase FlgJ